MLQIMKQKNKLYASNVRHSEVNQRIVQLPTFDFQANLSSIKWYYCLISGITFAKVS